MEKLTVRDVEISGKRIFMRADFNVPLDENQNITDNSRIEATLPTIQYILEKGGRLVLASHLGRPKGKVAPELSLRPVADKLSELLGKTVRLTPDCIGEESQRMADELKEGEALLLENLRFHKEEENNDEKFSKQLAEFGEVYVNDAFGAAHRAHSSTAGVTKFFHKCVAGLLLEKEINYLGEKINNPERPFIAILGGAKVSDKIEVIGNLLGKVDRLLIGGGMAYTFFKSEGFEIGKSLFEEDKVDMARQTMQTAKGIGVELLLPVDCIVADEFSEKANIKTVSKEQIPQGWQGMDIGSKTIELYKEKISEAKTIVWNGPMGVFEMDKFASGTNAVAKALAEATEKGATTIIGGGDTAAALSKAGLEKRVSHISTGGGASLEYLQGKTLPGIANLTQKE